MAARIVQFIRQVLPDVFEPWMAAAIAEKHDWVAQQSRDGVFDGLPKDASWQQFAHSLLLKTRDMFLQTTQRSPESHMSKNLTSD